jgi:outer membrane protein insertion porin family
MMSMTKNRRRGSATSATVAFAAMMAAFAVAGPAAAQQVVVQGNRRVDSETIRSYVSGGNAEEARRNLLATGLFSDVRVARSGPNIVVTVRENSVVSRVVFEGNRKVERVILESEVQTKARGPYSQAMIDADVQRISEIYRRVGRGSARVTYRVVELPDGRVDIVYTIEEGDKTGVRQINFYGNYVYTARRLRELMATSEMNFLSFLKSSDIYDPDRLASDLELIRRFYLKNGFADFRVVTSESHYDATAAGWIINITIEEGAQYRVGDVRVDSRIPDVDAARLRGRLRTYPGDVYNAEAVEKSLTEVTTEVARRGYAFAQVRPTGQRDPATQTINIAYVVEEGPRVYIERLNIRGNTRTRDYVIRREFDLGEGDAYNKVLVDRAERRLNSLGYFKRVRVTNEPGSAPDRVVINVDVEDQATGAFSVAGGYSTSDGFIGEVSISESNFLGRGQFVRLAGQYGQRTQGVDFSFTEPYFLGYRVAAGFDLFSKFSDQTQYSRYENRTTGGQLRLGLPITEELGITLRYSLYQSELKIPNTYKQPFNDCTVPLPGYTVIDPVTGQPLYPNCALDGEASVALKEAQGTTLTSLAGVTLGYSTLDNAKNPRNGFYAELKPDVAGLGGDSRFLRAAGEARYYKEFWEDIVGIARVQGGHIMAYGGHDLRIVDQYFLGPTLVRGFAPSGIGPRDISSGDANSNALGGTTYFGGSLEVQFPIYGIPRDLGLKGAVFADAGTLFGYAGKKVFDVNRDGVVNGLTGAGCAIAGITVQPECVQVHDSKTIRSAVGASLLWASPLGPIRFDYAYALSKDDGVIGANGVRAGGDQLQAFRFSGGTRF